MKCVSNTFPCLLRVLFFSVFLSFKWYVNSVLVKREKITSWKWHLSHFLLARVNRNLNVFFLSVVENDCRGNGITIFLRLYWECKWDVNIIYRATALGVNRTGGGLFLEGWHEYSNPNNCKFWDLDQWLFSHVTFVDFFLTLSYCGVTCVWIIYLWLDVWMYVIYMFTRKEKESFIESPNMAYIYSRIVTRLEYTDRQK